jgi:hypothetical protein
VKAGGGQEKGSEYERATGRKLSLWVSHGERADLFRRNVLSGGNFTNAVKRDSVEHGIPGDLGANHPLAYTFLTRFAVECKHYASLGFEAFLFDVKMDASFLGRVWTKARKEAAHTTRTTKRNMFPMVVARQNRRPSILLVDQMMGELLDQAVPSRIQRPVRWHLPQRTSMYLFEEVLSKTNASVFLQTVEALVKDVE